MKEIIIVGGANGSGKTTFSKHLIKSTGYVFLNADEIAKELNSVDVQSARIQAGRLFFQRFTNLSNRGDCFIVESTLSGNYLVDIIDKMSQKGYTVKIVYVFLENPSICIERIKQRVKLGGHSIPDEDVIRRFYKSRSRFWNVYKNIANDWVMYYNSSEGAEVIALGTGERYVVENENIFIQFIQSL